MLRIQPYILGSGRAAQALEKSLAILAVVDPSYSIAVPVRVRRDQSLIGLKKDKLFSLLLIANPHGLHAERILEADREVFDLIVSEKPACVSVAEAQSLSAVKTRVGVCHVYRQTWGVQMLKQMALAGEFGAIVAIEGRYWQSSAAQKAVALTPSANTWKNETRLSGAHDALLDIGTHWADAAVFIAGSLPTQTRVWLSYANAEAPHRDSHLHLQMKFEGGARALASVSKNVHGAANHFEINIIGAKKSATWNFLNPDQLVIGHGATQTLVSRAGEPCGSGQAAFHGVGWLEGYIEILRQALNQAAGRPFKAYPTLAESVRIVEMLLKAERDD